MIKKFLFFKLKSPFVIIFFIFIFGVGLLMGKVSAGEKEYVYDKINLNLFWEVLNIIEEKYVYSDEIDYEKIVEGAISGMVQSLDDYPTTFFNKEESKKFLEDTRGNFEGVGMEIGLKNGQLQVVTPLEGTPAERAGLRAGDDIIKIDDTLTINITPEEAVSLIRGKKGTSVKLTIFRESWNESREITVVRDIIEIPSMKIDFIEDSNLKFAHIKLIHFSAKSSYDFSQIAKKILNNKVDGIILDLRNNPGGYLEEAKEISNWFLREGDIITIQEGKDKRIEYKAKNNGQFYEYPTTIIINKGSASASEILASSIRENNNNPNIKIIGEESFGKGSVQELIRLKNGSSVKVTVAKWLTPKGNLIEGIGIKPDIEVDFSEEDYKENKDPQLEKAIDILKNIR